MAKRQATKQRKRSRSSVDVNRQILAVLTEISKTLDNILIQLPSDPDTRDVEEKLDAILRELQSQRR